MRCSLKVPGFLEPSIHCLTIGRSKAVPECLVARARSSAIQALDANCFMRGPRLLHLATLQPGFEMAKGGDRRRGRLQYVRPHSQASGLKGYGSRYYTVEFFLILFCLTASLLVLPLVLPPLPPPPFLLLFIPIGILLLLLILACMPSDLHNFSSSYL